MISLHAGHFSPVRRPTLATCSSHGSFGQGAARRSRRGRVARDGAAAGRDRTAPRVCGCRPRDDGHQRRVGRDRLARGRAARRRGGRARSLREPRPTGRPDPAGGDGGPRDRRHIGRGRAVLRRAGEGAARVARRRRLRRAQRRLRPVAAEARVRASRDSLPAARRRLHARRVPAARAGRAEPPARVAVRAPWRPARPRTRCARRRARDGGAAAAPARARDRARDGGARPCCIHAPPLARRHEASLGAAGAPGVRTGAPRRARGAGRDGRPRRGRRARRACERCPRRRGAEPRAGAGRLRRARSARGRGRGAQAASA